MNPIALPLKDAAAAVGVSVDTLKRAIRATASHDKDGNALYPPPLKGKRDSKGRVTVRVAELERWHDSLQDA